MSPSDLITLWHGIVLSRFLFNVFPVARAAFGFPIAQATYLQVITWPFCILLVIAKTFCWKLLKGFTPDILDKKCGIFIIL